jgi:tRNA 2-selenouridine synthase
MIERIEVATFLERIRNFLVLDVRSPQEFVQGNIPGAVNIPLFTDAEHSLIGTLYHQQGRNDAIVKGLDICLPKTSDYLQQIRKTKATDNILVYCWRGGMRSALMAEVFSTAGYQINILCGGYKSYRKFIRSGFSKEVTIVVLGGYAGSGKTLLLESLANQGEQVINLEKLAKHKGSVFGALGQGNQPTNEQFENNLYSHWSVLDSSRPIWIEDESRMIGNVTLPEPLIKRLSEEIMIRMEVPLSARINRLVQDYAGFDKSLLAEAILKIKERLGGGNTKEAVSSLLSGHYEKTAEILLAYYDKTYQFSMGKRNPGKTFQLTITSGNVEENAKKLIDYLKRILAK